MLNIKVVTWSMAIWTAVSFVLCVVYGLLTPHGGHMEAFLLQVLPWYELRSGKGFFLALVQSFLDGGYAGLAFALIYNFVQHLFAGSSTESSTC